MTVFLPVGLLNHTHYLKAMDNIEKIILDCDSYIREKTSAEFAFAGSCGLYLQNIFLGRDIHDIDIKFLKLPHQKAISLNLEFTPKIDILSDNRVKDVEYVKVELGNRTLLVEEAKSIVEAKKNMLDFLLNRAKIMDEWRIAQKEKFIRDLEYLKKEYNLE